MLLLCSFFRLKELFQVKNGVTTSLLFFLKMPKIWVGRTTVASDAFPDIGSVGRIDKKTEKGITRSLGIGGPGTKGGR